MNTNEIHKPPTNPDMDDVADRVKYCYAKVTKGLADMQHQLAELAGTGKLDRDESMDLQDQLAGLWEYLYAGTTSAVRDWRTNDSTWDWADNTYSDGTEVMTPGPGDNRTDTQRATDAAWPYHEFCDGDGAVQDMPYGNESVIANPPGGRGNQ